MDIADEAQNLTELELSIAVKNRKPELQETGLCHWCESIIGVGHFCDSDCRDDFEKSKRMKG